MSSTEQHTDARRDGGPGTDDDATQNVPRGTADSPMRDGAMARVAPRRDLSARRQNTGQSSEDGGGSAAAGAATATAGRGRSGGSAGSTARTGSGSTGTRAARPGRRTVGPRRVRLTMQRIDPWSVMKISFLVSVALGIAGVVMVAVLWTVLSGMNVFATINEFIGQVTTGEDAAASFDLMDYLGFGRVVSLAVVLGVVNVILLTALATLTAFLYNICSALVGGLHLTLADD